MLSNTCIHEINLIAGWHLCLTNGHPCRHIILDFKKAWLNDDVSCTSIQQDETAAVLRRFNVFVSVCEFCTFWGVVHHLCLNILNIQYSSSTSKLPGLSIHRNFMCRTLAFYPQKLENMKDRQPVIDDTAESITCYLKCPHDAKPQTNVYSQADWWERRNKKTTACGEQIYGLVKQMLEFSSRLKLCIKDNSACSILCLTEIKTCC